MSVQLGLETLLKEKRHEIKGLRLGLVASPASVDATLVSSLERLYSEPDIHLVALFGPEHGLRGNAQAGENVDSQIDAFTQLPVFSLYGKTYKPTPEMLENLDALVFDLQDGGLRFYTYLSTLAHVMQAAAEYGKRVIVLDRPVFLNGLKLEGNILDAAFTSFVGIYPIPIRYGMTAGEIAMLFNQHFGIHCHLTVIPMRGYKREMWFDQTGLPFIPPSPNLPTLTSIIVYAGSCLFEGTNISEGRGTTKPFEYIGAPFIDGHRLAQTMNQLELSGLRFREVNFVPMFSKYQGQLCGGVQLYITERNTFEPVKTVLHLIKAIKQHFADFAWRQPEQGGSYFIDLLAGGTQLRKWSETNQSVDSIIDLWKEDLAGFAELRQPFLIYQ